MTEMFDVLLTFGNGNLFNYIGCPELVKIFWVKLNQKWDETSLTAFFFRFLDMIFSVFFLENQALLHITQHITQHGPSRRIAKFAISLDS